MSTEAANAALITEAANQAAWSHVSKAIRAAHSAEVSSTDNHAARYAATARVEAEMVKAAAKTAAAALESIAYATDAPPTAEQIARARYFALESREAAEVAEVHATRAEFAFRV